MMKKSKKNILEKHSKEIIAKEATKRLFTKRIEGFDARKQELLLKLYNEIIEEKK